MRSLTAALASCLIVAPAFAQDPEPARDGPGAPVVELGEVVVRTTRLDARPEDTPAAVTVVGATDLGLEHAASSLPDALSHVPGVMVQKTTRGFGSPYLRGFTGHRALTLIDGIRLNNTTFRDGPNQYNGTIDLFDVAWVEVNRGPGSVLHGSDAVGGRIDIVPRTYLPGSSAPNTLRAQYRGATNEATNATHLSYDFGGERWGGVLGATYRALGDLRAGGPSGRQPGTGFDELGLNGSLTFDVSDRVRLLLAAQTYTQDDVPRFHRTVQSHGWHGTQAGTDLENLFDQRRHLGYARLTFRPEAGPVGRGQLTISLQRQAEENDRTTGAGAHSLQGFDVDTWGADLQLGTALGRHTLTYGLEGYLDAVDSFRTSFAADGSVAARDVQGPVGDDAGYWSLGAYLKDRVALGERASVEAGVRYNEARLSADKVKDPVSGQVTSVSDRWSAVVGEVRGLAEVLPGLDLYASLAQGFRAPNLSDMTTYDLAEQGQVELPAFDLTPERFLSYELGAKARGKYVAGGVALFRTDITDMIDRYFSGETVTLPSGQTAAVVRKANVANGFVHGFEVDADVRLHPAVTLGGQLFWTFGEADTTVVDATGPRLERHPLSRVAPLTGLLRVRVAPSRTWWAEAELQAAGEQSRLSLKDAKDTTRIPPGGTPGYAVVNVRGGARLGQHVDLVLAVRNVTDVDYRIHGSGINEPGFGVELGARITVGP